MVVGGGVIGCSILYHLAKLGWTDSVLVEQYQLTHGSTWHSAGLVGQPYETLIQEYLALPLKDTVKEKWLFKNAARIFGFE